MTDTPPHVKIVDFSPTPLMDAETKAVTLEYLQELVDEVKKGQVSAVFIVVGYGLEGTGGFRSGHQNCALLGRIEYFKSRVIEGMT